MMQPVISSFKRYVETYLAYHYHMFGGWGDVNDLVLEGLIAKALQQDTSNKVTWVQGGHLPYDIDCNGVKIQVKGTLLNNSHIHLSSFRLGTHEQNLKEGIVKLVSQTDVWMVVVRSTTEETMKLWCFELDKTSFIFDQNLYEFTKKQTSKNTVLYECNKDKVRAIVRPSTSHQLWYNCKFDEFKTLPGVKLLDTWEYTKNLLPTVLHLNAT